jgi:hypothetical protein
MSLRFLSDPLKAPGAIRSVKGKGCESLLNTAAYPLKVMPSSVSRTSNCAEIDSGL